MKHKVVYIDGRRDAYAPEQLMDGYTPMTVAELIEYLEYNCDKDAYVMINNDNGYTYGTILESSFTNSTFEDDEEDEEDEDEYGEDLTYILDIELGDDDTPEGGTSFNGETVRDFIDEIDYSERPHNIEELNKLLKECGIKPIKI